MKLYRIVGFLSVGLAMAQPAADPAATAKKALDLLLAGDYGAISQMFSPDLQKAIPPPALEKVGEQVKTWGKPEKISDPEVRKAGANTIVLFPVKFAAQTIDFRFAVNATGQIAIMNFTRGEVAWSRPPYSKPEAFQERPVTIGDDDWKLPGTLTIPAGAGPFPGIVLVHGSGPNDRDETVGAVKVFKDFAEGLASRGIAVIRYEKRTKQYASRMAGKSGLTVYDETVDDAVRAATVLRAQKEIDPKRVYVLGHSLGGYVAPRIAEADGKLAGMVILSGNARPLEDLIVEQSEYLGTKQAQMDALKAQAARIKTLEPADLDAPPIMNMPVSYLLDLKGYDAVAEARKVTTPMLILQGERDFQVTMKDFNMWKSGLAGRKDVTFRSYPALNHLLVAGEGKSTAAEYSKPGHVAPEVIDEIAKWVK